jgi:hypothetical protein
MSTQILDSLHIRSLSLSSVKYYHKGILLSGDEDKIHSASHRNYCLPGSQGSLLPEEYTVCVSIKNSGPLQIKSLDLR